MRVVVFVKSGERFSVVVAEPIRGVAGVTRDLDGVVFSFSEDLEAGVDGDVVLSLVLHVHTEFIPPLVVGKNTGMVSTLKKTTLCHIIM